MMLLFCLIPASFACLPGYATTALQTKTYIQDLTSNAVGTFDMPTSTFTPICTHNGIQCNLFPDAGSGSSAHSFQDTYFTKDGSFVFFVKGGSEVRKLSLISPIFTTSISIGSNTIRRVRMNLDESLLYVWLATEKAWYTYDVNS